MPACGLWNEYSFVIPVLLSYAEKVRFLLRKYGYTSCKTTSERSGYNEWAYQVLWRTLFCQHHAPRCIWEGYIFLANTNLKLLFLSNKIGNTNTDVFAWIYFQKALTKFKILWKGCSRKSKTPTKLSRDSLVSHVLRTICRSLFLSVNSEYSC